ncbi:hypothetical protein MLD38_017640 [Melastoma candidum]|uniref:Uncharacterized protein n=1 Tax=Melastoma candidum TaxID=119954 RepID=A0ACB9QZI3_9MYRT|nr:hypothetical protein MLD38_017640 [Melastoma candidum]
MPGEVELGPPLFPGQPCDRGFFPTKRIPRDVPNGHMAVYVGEDEKRYVVSLSVLDDPPFWELLDEAREWSAVEMVPSNKDVENTNIVVTQMDATESSWYSALLHHASVYGIAAGYCISASLLSIINKWAVMKFPYPAIIFYLSLFTNSELLLHANVDTFIVFRSAVPIFVAIGETLFLNQPWPSLKTWMSLATIFGGSVLYVITDYQFTVMAYSWALAYLISMSVDFVYIKHVVMTIGLNTWGLVLYNNLEALLLFPLELLIMGELKKIKHEITDESDWDSFEVVLPVGLSGVFGLAISFFGFSCRRAISATGFTVLGIVNKLLTVVINLMIWDKHSKLLGTVGLLICMFGGILYQQSTSKPKPADETQEKQRNEEQQKLLEMQATPQLKDDDDLDQQ